jgi:hypothetical protein
MTIQDLFKEVERSPVAEKWRLIDRVLRSLECPPQLPLEEREPKI